MAEYSGKDKRLAYLFEAVENVQVDDMTGASASTDGAHGLVPAPLAGDEDKYLRGDGTWAAVQAGAGSLSGLSDVNLTAPTNGQALVYDGANSKWINGNVSGGGNTLVIQDASIYSTDEQQVGVWTDGRPIYKKTWIFNTWITVNQNSIFSLASKGVSISNLGVITSSEAIMTLDKRSMFPVAVGMRSGDISIFNYSGLAMDIDGITLYYTKTTDAAGSGGYKAYGLSPIIYSEEEREVGVWTDGKPLYQKTYEFSTVIPVSANTYTTIVSSAGLNIDTLVYGETSPSKEATFTPISVNVTANGDIQCYYTTAWSIKYLTIRYTKTTDTAGSGTWTTTGEYAHHYSTSEKVIGTWIDGKPLYEITLTGTTDSRNPTNVITHGIANIELITDITGIIDRGDGTSYTVNFPRSGNTVWCQCNTTTLSLVGYNSSDFLEKNYCVTIRYTKTTD